MQSKLTWEHMITTSMCDTAGRLGIPGTFDLFMDMAARHSHLLGCGALALAKENRYWVIAKSLIKFIKRPAMTQTVILSTWPEASRGRAGLKGNRDFEVRSKEGELLISGKSEWVILDKNSGGYIALDSVMPEGFEYCGDLACPQSYFKIRDDFSEAPSASYKVLNLDTDFVGHMNNVAYIRAFANCFTAEEWLKMDIKEMEIHFRQQCFEGDVLDFASRPGQDGYTEVQASVKGATKALLRYK